MTNGIRSSSNRSRVRLGRAEIAAAIVSLWFFIGLGYSARAATIDVDTTADELDLDGNCSLREAIQAANTDTAVDGCAAGSGADTVTVPSGTFALSIAGVGEDGNATGDLDVTDSLTITGAGANTTIIDATFEGASPPDRAIEIIGSSQVEISGVTIRNGRAFDVGGAIKNGDRFTHAARLVLRNCIIANSAAGSTGGASPTKVHWKYSVPAWRTTRRRMRPAESTTPRAPL
jgi:CSLREA domain-containing protein